MNCPHIEDALLHLLEATVDTDTIMSVFNDCLLKQDVFHQLELASHSNTTVVNYDSKYSCCSESASSFDEEAIPVSDLIDLIYS